MGRNIRLDGFGYNVSLRELGIKLEQLRGCAFHSLFQIAAGGDLAEMWSETEKSIPPGPRLGVHLRVGDVDLLRAADFRGVIFNKQWGAGTAAQGAFLAIKCAEDLAVQAGFQDPCVIIFESDSVTAKDAASSSRTRGPCQVWTSALTPRHSARGYGVKGGPRISPHVVSVESWLSFARVSSVEILLETLSEFGEVAGQIGPGLEDSNRLFKFEDFMIASRKERRHDRMAIRCPAH